LDPAAVIREAPEWALAHGMIPRGYAALSAAVANRDGSETDPAPLEVDRLANLFATLGLYEEAIAIDRATLERAPSDWNAARRLIWCLLQQRRWEEASRTSRALDRDNARRGEASGWSQTVDLVVEATPQRRAAFVALMPLMRLSDVGLLRQGTVPPVARQAR